MLQKLSLAAIILAASSLSAQAENSYYASLDMGLSSNSMSLKGELANVPQEKSQGEYFGLSLGYRAMSENGYFGGLEFSFGAASGQSEISDCCASINVTSKSISGLYLTAGKAFGDNKNFLLYGLIGVGGTKAKISAELLGETTSETDNGEGISFGIASEYKFNEKFGIRLRAVQNRYKGELDELKIRDSVITAGLIMNF